MVGPHTWDGAQGDPWAYGPVDGLQLMHKVTDSLTYPSAPEAAEARFQVIVPTAQAGEGMELGAPVAVELVVDGGVAATFHGRVGDVTAEPHSLGMLYTLNCLDYVADLRETTVGEVAWPAERIWDRVVRILAEAGYEEPAIQLVGGLPPQPSPYVGPREASPADALSLVDQYLSQWPVEYFTSHTEAFGYGRPYLIAVADPDTRVFSHWAVRVTPEFPSYSAPLGMYWNATSGRWELEVRRLSVGGVPVLPAGVIPASEVDWSSKWAITKADAATRVTLSGTFTVGERLVVADSGVVPPVNAQMEVELADVDVAQRLALMYLPEGTPTSRWTADEFTWHLALADDRDVNVPDLADVVTVWDLDPTRTPTGRRWYTAQVASYVLEVADSRPVLKFTLRRPDLEANGNVQLATWDSPGSDVGPDPTWDTVAPGITWDDFKLVN